VKVFFYVQLNSANKLIKKAGIKGRQAGLELVNTIPNLAKEPARNPLFVRLKFVPTSGVAHSCYIRHLNV